MLNFVRPKTRIGMNFEEMLSRSDRGPLRQEQLLIGALGRKQIEGKYRNVVTVRYDLSNRQGFRDALDADQRYSMTLNSPHQMHFEMKGDDAGLRLELEQGNYQTLASLLLNNPAVVAEKNFVGELVAQLIEVLGRLHADGVCQVCLAPQNILMLKGDSNRPLLLCHGSFYQGRGLEQILYK